MEYHIVGGRNQITPNVAVILNGYTGQMGLGGYRTLQIEVDGVLSPEQGLTSSFRGVSVRWLRDDRDIWSVSSAGMAGTADITGIVQGRGTEPPTKPPFFIPEGKEGKIDPKVIIIAIIVFILLSRS